MDCKIWNCFRRQNTKTLKKLKIWKFLNFINTFPCPSCGTRPLSYFCLLWRLWMRKKIVFKRLPLRLLFHKKSYVILLCTHKRSETSSLSLDFALLLINKDTFHSHRSLPVSNPPKVLLGCCLITIKPIRCITISESSTLSIHSVSPKRREYKIGGRR